MEAAYKMSMFMPARFTAAAPRPAGGSATTITTGLVDTTSTPTLLKLVAEGRLDTTPFATHRFELGEIGEAYDVFSDAANTNALKVVLSS